MRANRQCERLGDERPARGGGARAGRFGGERDEPVTCSLRYKRRIVNNAQKPDCVSLDLETILENAPVQPNKLDIKWLEIVCAFHESRDMTMCRILWSTPVGYRSFSTDVSENTTI